MRNFCFLLVLLSAACGAPTNPAEPQQNLPGDRQIDPVDPVNTDPVCGNGQVEAGETCDDGNLETGDGCDAQCANEEVVIEDDHGDTAADASQLPIGAPQRGVFERAEDVDVFAITIAMEGRYIVAAEGAGTLNCKLSSADGETLADESGDGSCEATVALSSGAYTLSLSLDAGETPARYMVRLQAAGDEPADDRCGDGNRDLGEGCDDGNNEAGDGCDPNCQPELGDDIQGDTRDQAAALALGQVVESALNVGGDVDYYTFTTEAAGEYQVNTTGSTDTYCHLENGQGEDIATNDDGGEGLNCQLIEELEANTQYYLKVRGFNETRVGAYTVTVSYLTPPVCGNGQVERNEACDDGNNVDGDGCDATCSIEDDFGNDVDGAHAIQDPSTTEGNLIEDDMDFFRFTAAATGLRQIHTTGGTDTYCHLLDGQGNQIAADDDGGEMTNCEIQHELTAGVTYIIKVRGFSTRVTGDYTLHLGEPVEAP